MLRKFCSILSLLMLSMLGINAAATRPARCYSLLNDSAIICTQFREGYYYNPHTDRCEHFVMVCRDDYDQMYASEQACERNCIYYAPGSWRFRRPRPPVEEEYQPETKS